MPKATVLMAVYNGEHYLREAVESILVQSFQDFDFLIINDGSTDKTWELLKSYNDPRIKLINNGQNLGLTRSLNKGLKLAEGQFIARQDADDISEPERLTKQVAFLETHPELALLGTGYKEIDDQGNVLGEKKLPCDYTQIRWDILFYCPFVHSAVMLRKSIVLEQIGFYNEALTYSMDYELWSRIARRLPVANLNECLVRLRTNPWSMTETYGERTLEGFRIRVATVADLLGWDKTNTALNEVRFHRMTTLLFGFGADVEFSLQDANDVIEEILRLYTAFCQFYKISPRDCRIGRVRLCTHLSYGLIDLAHRYLHQHHSAIWQLLVRAYSLYWPIVLTKRNARLVLKLLT